MPPRTCSLAITAGDHVELLPEKLGTADADAALRHLLGRELTVLGATSGGAKVLLSHDGVTLWARGDQVRHRSPRARVDDDGDDDDDNDNDDDDGN